ncbi:VWA domain-containing protein [Spongiimicrobium salis]|uniref:VWA domain-containing protein n=1 Tax=Spongiimicrobium salis TaxID=1667022 RepID=UPI00374CCE47
MQTTTLALMILAAIAALGLVLLQYYYKTKKRGKLQKLLSFFRFIALFSLFLLLINPKMIKEEYELEKANLIVLSDNSSSIAATQGIAQLNQVGNALRENTALSDKFNIEHYSFGAFLNDRDSLSFSEKTTDITKALTTAEEIFGKENSAVVVLTDGNQTLGRDYEFYGNTTSGFPIYPVVIGDTTQYEDIRVGQVNSNAYAFLKNKFPLETYILYEGKGSVTSNVKIQMNGKVIHQERVQLSEANTTKKINILIEANTVGVKTIKISADPLQNEKNRENNSKSTAVEVIDEKTKIAVISAIKHPDVGALRKAIESNEQRAASIYGPNAAASSLEDTDVFILYQPTRAFARIYEYLEKKGASVWTITGSKTDWNFLNAVQDDFEKSNYNQPEEVFPVLNPAFGVFNTEDFSTEDFPPLWGSLGDIVLKNGGEVILNQRIKGVNLDIPLLAIVGNDSQRAAVLFGEDIWKWRIQAYRNDQDFQNFDDFIGKLMLYLATTKAKSRLSVDYKAIYSGSKDARIAATYFDETFVFDENATINLLINSVDQTTRKEIPMLMKGNFYEADLSDLPTGDYTFSVKVANENLNRSGSFTILDFDVEKQFLSSNYGKLGRLAQQSSGKLYYPNESADLIRNLLEDERLVPIQKSKENVVSLIDFKFLLGIIILTLAIEWFIRKFNGLI